MPVLAEPGRRLTARLVDALFLLLISAGFFLLLLWFAGTYAVSDPATGEITDASAVAVVLFALACLAADLLTVVLYEVLPVARSGRTPGRVLLGVRVVRMADGRPPGFGASLLRWLVVAVPGLVLLAGPVLGFLSIYLDPAGRWRGWHDRMCDTVVVRG